MKQRDETGIELFGKYGLAASIALVCLLAFAFCTVSVFAEETGGKDLRAFYQQNCVRCHGPDGSAVNAAGQKLRGQDFTDQNWQRSARDEDMVGTILKGKFFGWAMPSYKDKLTADEASRMVTDIIRKCRKGQMIAPLAQ